MKLVFLKLVFSYEDLRSWIEEARKLNEKRDVEEAAWEEDIILATELLY